VQSMLQQLRHARLALCKCRKLHHQLRYFHPRNWLQSVLQQLHPHLPAARCLLGVTKNVSQSPPARLRCCGSCTHWPIITAAMPL
jgi:hypothetical protein